MEIETEARVLQAFEKIRRKLLLREGVEFSRAIQLPEMTIIACKGRIGQFIGKQGIGIKELSKELNQKIRLVEDSKDAKKMVSDIIGNARLVGLNEIFSPTGKMFKIIVHKADSKRLVASKESLERAVEELLQTKAMIQFG